MVSTTPDPDFKSTAVAKRNQNFLDALEFVDENIKAREHMKVSVWRSMIPRGAYTLGEGLVKKSYRFHPGLGDQRGLQTWRPIQISRAASGEDPGVDACEYNPYLVDYGFETISYTGLQTERVTKPLCIRDIRFVWQFRQQLGLIMNFLGDITVSVWENWAREQYVKFCADNGNFYVLGDGSPTSVTATYDPFSVDGDGDNTITIAVGQVSSLNWSYMRWYSRWLQMQVPQAAIGSEGGRPMFGLVLDLEDWDKMIERDSDLRSDWREYSPSTLIKNYGTVHTYKGFSLMHDMATPRFKIKSTTATTLTLERVDPLVEDEAVTIGNKVNVNQDYLNAEFALGVIFLKDVLKLEVPPAGPSSPGGGTSFGATPSLNGEFHWINEYDKETNMLKENGFYFGRYEGFAKPLTYDQDAVCFLYRREGYSNQSEVIIQGSTLVADGTANDVVADAVAADVSATTNLVTLTLNGVFSGEVGQAAIITDDDATECTSAILADASQAPTYTFAVTAWGSASQLHTKYTAAGGAHAHMVA